MLTLLYVVFSFEEGGRRKCGQYWPLERDSRIRFGFLTVTNLGVENMNHYKKTTLEIHNTEVNPSFCFLTFFKLGENCKENLQREKQESRQLISYFHFSGNRIRIFSSEPI